MGIKRKFDISQNIAKNFILMQKELEEVVKETNKSMIEVYDMFLSDLQNYYDDNYKKKIEGITLKNFSTQSINKIYEHVNKLKKNLEEKESKDKRRQEKQQADDEKMQEMETKWLEIERSIDEFVFDEKQGTEKEILQKLISDINQPNSSYEFDNKTKKYIVKRINARLEEVNRKEAERKKVETAMKQIETIVEREYEKGNVKNKANYLEAIRDAITGTEERIDLNIKIGEAQQEELLQMIDEKIKIEKDEMYFEQVRSFTDDFRFLRAYSETANAIYGTKKRKFTDMESYHRYCELRIKLQKEDDEYTQIKKLINNKKIDETDRRILLARKEYMDRQIEKKNKIGEVR